MSDRISTGATLLIGHKGAIHATALAADRHHFSFACLAVVRKFLLSATSRQGRQALLRNTRKTGRVRVTTRLEVFLSFPGARTAPFALLRKHLALDHESGPRVKRLVFATREASL